jgi:hypothetical protein
MRIACMSSSPPDAHRTALTSQKVPMKVTPAAVRRQLEQLGYTDVPEEVVLEFLAELKVEASRAAQEASTSLRP